MSRLIRFLQYLLLVLLIAATGLWIFGGKKAEYSTRIAIDARPEQIFPYLTQPDRLKQWISGLKKIDEVLPPPEGYGPKPERVREWQIRDGKTTRFNDVVIRFNPNKLISIQSSSRDQIITSIYKLESKDSGTTLLTHQVKRSYVGLGRLIHPFRPTDLQDRIDHDTLQLKELVEKNEPALPAHSSRDDNTDGDGNDANDEGPAYEVPNFGDPQNSPLP